MGLILILGCSTSRKRQAPYHRRVGVPEGKRSENVESTYGYTANGSIIHTYMADSSTVIQLPKYYDMLRAWATSFRVTCNQKETRCKLWKRLHYKKRKNWTSARYVCIRCVQNYMSGLCATDL